MDVNSLPPNAFCYFFQDLNGPIRAFFFSFFFWACYGSSIFYISVNFLTRNKRRNGRERSQKSIVFQEEKQTVNRERKRKSEEQT